MAKSKGKRRGPPPGVKPKNYEMFRAASIEHQWAPGHKGQSTKQIKDTAHLKDWIEEYDNHIEEKPESIATLSPGEIKEIAAPILPCPPKIDRRRKVIPPHIKTHAERVQEFLEQIKPSREKFLDNDIVSIVKNYRECK